MAKDQTFSNIVSEQVPWDIRVDWPTVYPVVGAFVFMFVMTITCIVSKKVADRRMKRKVSIIEILHRCYYILVIENVSFISSTMT